MISINTLRLINADLARLFQSAFCIAKSVKIILRVKIIKSKTYPQNDKYHFEGRKISLKNIPLKRSKSI